MSAVVIGGGLAGLSAALTLQEAGESVELYEASDAVGGRVRSDFIDGFILDRGFQLINAGYSELIRLDVISEIEFCAAKRSVDVVTPYGVVTICDPRMHPIQALRNPLGTPREKIAVLKFLYAEANPQISLRDALLASGTGNFFYNVLNPFLRGVFLTDLEKVDSAYGREVMRSFLLGKSGLPSAGVGTLSEALAARIETIHLNSPIESLAQFSGKKIVLATDCRSAEKLLGISTTGELAASTTWYHSIPQGMITHGKLRVTSARSSLVNSIAISNLAPQYAPAGCTLISSTALQAISDEEVRDEIAKFWSLAPNDLELVKRYEIRDSLPIFAPGKSKAMSSQVGENIYRAGDYLTAGSQNGALLSGRLAALELLTH